MKKVYYDIEGNAFYDINPNWFIIGMHQKLGNKTQNQYWQTGWKQNMRNLKTLEVLDDKGKPSGSRWKIISIDQLNNDIYRIKEQRASTYIALADTCKQKSC